MPTVDVSPTHYTIDGKPYLRVTEVIKRVFPQPDLQDWRASVGKIRADRYLKHSAHVGTTVDKTITRLLMKPGSKLLIPTQAEVKMALRGWTKWQTLNDIQAVACQELVWSEELGVAGTLDCRTAAEIIDWKASSRIRPEYVLQVNTYWGLLPEAVRDTIRQARIVRFDKLLGDWEERKIYFRPDLFDLFVSMVEVYRGWQTLTEPEEGV